MIRIKRSPSQRGYTVDVKSSAVETEMRGGLSRSRRDVPQPDRVVSLSYTVGVAEAGAFEALYERLAMTGEVFQTDLIIDEFAMRPYQCRMVPGSFRVNWLGGDRARVSLRAEVAPSADFTPAGDEALMDFFEGYRDDAGQIAALLALLVNEDLPN